MAISDGSTVAWEVFQSIERSAALESPDRSRNRLGRSRWALEKAWSLMTSLEGLDQVSANGAKSRLKPSCLIPRTMV